MAADESSVSEQQQQQQQQLPPPQTQQEEAEGENNKSTISAPTEISRTFTPLPPIRRTSTLDLSRKAGPKVEDDSHTAPSPTENDMNPPMSSGPADVAQQSSDDQWRSSPSAADAGQLVAQSSGQSSAPHNHNHISPHPHQQQQQSTPDMNQNPNPDGRSAQPAMPQHFNGLAVLPRGPGMQMPMHPHQMLMGRACPQGAPAPMMVNGQTVISLPDGRQWTAQESHLAEPLNPSNRNRSANSLRTYSAFDKETGGESRPSLQYGKSAPSLQPQSRPPNTSHSAASTGGMRDQAAYPDPSDEKSAFPWHQSQEPSSQHSNDLGPADMADDKSFYSRASVRQDSVSVSSITNEDASDKNKRSQTSLFNFGHRRDSSAATAEQGPLDGSPERGRNFFSRIGHSQPKPKPNALATAPSFDGSDQASLHQAGDAVPGKKRLSELKGMIKGVGHAKEGIKDDRPIKIETIHEYTQALPSSPPHHDPTPLHEVKRQPNPYIPQRPLESFGAAMRPVAPSAPQASIETHVTGGVPPKGPAPFMGIGRTSTGGSLPGPNQQGKNEENGKKGSSSGFLGGLFNKQGNKTKEVKPQSSNQPPPASQRSAQPAIQSSGYTAFRPGQMSLPGQQLGPHPMLAGQPRIQIPPPKSPSPTILSDPSQPAPSLQTAQAITMHRAAEITVSSHGSHGSAILSSHRSEKPPSQHSQGMFNKYNAGSFGQRPVQTEAPDDDSVTTSQASLQLSDKSVGNLSTMSRIAPKRQPPESANVKTDGPFMTSAVPPTIASMDRSIVSPTPSSGERAPSQLSQHAGHSPQLGGIRETHHSNPSPIPSPIPSQSNRSSESRPPGDHFGRDSIDFRGSAEGLGVFPNGLLSSGPINGSGHGGGQNGLAWGPNGSLAPSLTTGKTQSSRVPSSPAPSTDPGNLSKFFGAYDGGKPAVQPQPPKEKSVASKLLGAFKRKDKQNDTPQPERRPKISPRASKQDIRSGPSAQKGNATFPVGLPGSSSQPQPVRATTNMSAQQMRAGKDSLNQISSYMMMPPSQSGRGQNAGQMASSMGPGARGQKPSGSDPLSIQNQRPTSPKKQSDEPQYDQVPIPRGYEAVRGGMPDISPYHAGRTQYPPAVQYTQQQQPPAGMQPGFAQRQWDPRAMPQTRPGLPPGSAMPGQQGVPNNVPYHPNPAHPQLRGQPLNTAPGMQTFYAPGPNQVPPQQFHAPQHMPPIQTSQSMPGQIRMATQTPLNAHGQSPNQAYPNYAGATQVQPNHMWTTTPPPRQSPTPMGPPALQLNIQHVPGAGSIASNGASPAPSNHIATAAPNPTSPVSQTSAPVQFQSPTSSPGMRSPDAARLTSRMSVSRHGNRNASTSHVPHERDLNLDVERANGHVRQPSEDIYDATPRLDRETPSVNGVGPSVTAASIASSSSIATTSVGSAGVIANDSTSFGTGRGSETDMRGGLERKREEHEEKQVAISFEVPVEPEEKILVDLPVELAAVHDDDDGIPMMSATSYPGQEWNPYGAGEFGDWD